MTPEQFESWWSDGLFAVLRSIAGHHYYLLPDSVRRSYDYEDMLGDALAAVFEATIPHRFKDRTGFEHFCKYVMRKNCQMIRKLWQVKKRTAAAVISTQDFEGDGWVPRHREPDVNPDDETAFAWRVMIQRGLVPLDTDTVCFPCGDPASRLTSGRRPETGEQLRTCYDPRCRAMKASEQALVRGTTAMRMPYEHAAVPATRSALTFADNA